MPRYYTIRRSGGSYAGVTGPFATADEATADIAEWAAFQEPPLGIAGMFRIAALDTEPRAVSRARLREAAKREGITDHPARLRQQLHEARRVLAGVPEEYVLTLAMAVLAEAGHQDADPAASALISPASGTFAMLLGAYGSAGEQSQVWAREKMEAAK
jgi:hypothetical protein